MAIKSKINDEMNSPFTSMIDIVFLLLIFFILQPFKEPENKMAAELPQEGAGGGVSMEVPLKDINIAIFSVGRSNPDKAVFTVGGNRIASGPKIYKRIAAELKRQSGGNKETPVAILPASEVHFKHVLDALDACYEAQMPKVKFGGDPSTIKK